MAEIIVDYSELGNRFHKYNDNFWNMNMDPGFPKAPRPAVGDVVTLTGYRVDPYTSSETASVQFHYMEEGGTGYMIEANTREGATTIYAAGVDDAIASGTVSFTITDVEEGDEVWIVSMVFGTPPIEEKALGGNAVTFFREKIEGMVGDLSDLTTADKTNLVAAINEAAAGGGGGPTVVQTTGTSTTSVMSQDAATKLVYPNISSNANGIGIRGIPSGSAAVSIGGNSQAIGTLSAAFGYGATAVGNKSFAAGNEAYAWADSSVAVGYKATANSQGEFAIGTVNNNGYNNTNYRLISGVHDPQSAHDAATKGYVDGLVGNIAAALNAINNGGGN